ncbi:glycoside hydrolase family 3 C-terminal domain-containing protein [Mycolicibacterium sediminis]|uniref:Exo-alpha-(1->6)-L-arabinopyranosidase n=2 Tax=Mycolicibacterium sediminis TaxID=1286180 RepID=A0A7I7QRJ0_9MYCO|nr:glycosyl hydrolase [Mycolicibacterium sediminis]
MDASSADTSLLPLDQRAALGGGASFWRTKSAPGVAAVAMSDGPHGVRYQSGAGDHLGFGASDPATCFPPAVGLAQSWDPDLAHRIGGALADEAQAAGLGVLLGPGINVKRDPRCGRNFEYFSEDPHLSGVLAAAWVRGLQSGGVGASLKHFAVNNQEHDRMRTSAEVDERTLHEIYLRAFERVVRDARPWTVMCSYNRINGVYASQNRWLLTDVLRDAWGFDGLVVSDWGAVADRVAAVDAGLDLQMPGDTAGDDAAVVAAVSDGRLTEAAVTRAADAVARLSARVAAGRREVTVDVDAHHRLAREAAGRSIVLLKNDDALLPLDPSRDVAVLGPFARSPRFQGGGSSHVTPTRVDSPLDEIRARIDGRVTFAEGFRLHADGSADASADDGAALRAEAVRVAGAADVAVIFAGLAASQESEGFDRDDIDLPADQLDLIAEVASAQPNTVVILSAGGVLHLAPVHEAARAILGGALLGQAGGGGIADVLTGVVNPSGRLAETVPLRLQDAPSYPHFPGEHSRVRYGEGIFVGYRGYDVRDQDVLYPFGHGLSYTTFEYSDIALSADPDGVDAVVTVRNTGRRAGREVVQIYASVPESSTSRAPRELVGFGSVDLAAGDSATVSVRVERRDLAYWHDRLDRWVVEGGTYRIAAGASSRDLRIEADVEIVGDSVRQDFDAESTIGELMSDPVGAKVLEEVLASFGPLGEDGGESLGIDMVRMAASIPIGRAVRSFGGGGVSADDVQALLDSINSRR